MINAIETLPALRALMIVSWLAYTNCWTTQWSMDWDVIRFMWYHCNEPIYFYHNWSYMIISVPLKISVWFSIPHCNRHIFWYISPIILVGVITFMTSLMISVIIDNNSNSLHLSVSLFVGCSLVCILLIRTNKPNQIWPPLFIWSDESNQHWFDVKGTGTSGCDPISLFETALVCNQWSKSKKSSIVDIDNPKFIMYQNDICKKKEFVLELISLYTINICNTVYHRLKLCSSVNRRPVPIMINYFGIHRIV